MPKPSDRGKLSRAFIGLGSNIHNRRGFLEAALAMLEDHAGISVLRRTGFEETQPWGYAEQPPFLNAVAELSTSLEPVELLKALKEIERRVGRVPRDVRWGPREIDLDILLFGERVVQLDDLVIPHPCLEARPFVLRQLLELDGNIAHPTTGVPYQTHLGR